MKKEQNSKIITCLYLIIAILVLNVICNFIIISKIGTTDNSNSNNNTNTTNSSSDNYDVSMFTSLQPSEITKKIKSGEQFVLYIGREGCTYCKKMLPTLQQAQSNYKYTTVYLDIDKVTISSTEYKEMASLLNVQKTVSGETKEFGQFQLTPMIAVLKDGKMVDGMIGYNTYDNFAKFLEEAGIKK